MILFETSRFTVDIGIVGEDKEPQYLVRNKDTNVVEFCNTSLYFVRDWAVQMTDALIEQEKKEDEPASLVMEAPKGKSN